jgi:hypothetical protein
MLWSRIICMWIPDENFDAAPAPTLLLYTVYSA